LVREVHDACDPFAIDIGTDQFGAAVQIGQHFFQRTDPTVFGMLLRHQRGVMPGMEFPDRIGIVGDPKAEVRPSYASEVLAGSRRQ
jgi:hypothetical protein